MEVVLSQIASLVHGRIVGDSDVVIRGAAPFETAGDARNTETPERTLVQVDNPMVAFAKVLQYFHPAAVPPAEIHPRAEIGIGFKCGCNVCIGPMVVVGRDVVVGERVRLHAGVVIGDGVTIGDDVIIYPNVTILDGCTIGSRVIVHSGTVIGSDGFGFAPDGQTYHKIPHLGSVQIGDDVEIGANNTIDRGTFGRTIVGRGVKTDNLVHIAHNVTVGDNTVLVAQVGISGSVTIGKNAVLAGQAGVAGHLTIGDGATVGPRTGVAKSVPAGTIVSSSNPEMPHKLWLRVQRLVPKLPEINKRLSAVEKQLRKLEGKLK